MREATVQPVYGIHKGVAMRLLTLDSNMDAADQLEYHIIS
jgi:hypothetical protein